MSKLRISVVTPSYNQGEYLEQAILSVLEQKYSEVEHIVMDGGSTDASVGILRRYPHLIWRSEADRGQSHALNKALALATGDIVAVMNADDWYPPGVFEQVAAVLEHHQVVMGRFELIDDQGKPMYQVANVERSWHDMLRYWVPYSIPPHPSIFMRRSLLLECRYPDGSFIDEDIHIPMDYDLYLRASRIAPFAQRIESVVFYYRMTATNKTSHQTEGVPYAEPENSRVFRRAEQAVVGGHRRAGFVIPAAGCTAEVRETVISALTQTIPEAEIIVADYSDSRGKSKELRSFVAEVNEQQRQKRHDTYVYRVVPEHLTHGAALARGIAACAATVVVLLEPGALAGSTAVEALHRIFSVDRIGAALPAGSNFTLRSHLDRDASPFALLTAGEPYSPVAAFRKVALLEFGPLPFAGHPELAVRWLLLSMLNRGWAVDTGRELRITQPAAVFPWLEADRNYMVAQVLSDLADQTVGSPFGQHRARCGAALPLMVEVVQEARKLLTAAPHEWYDLLSRQSPAEITASFPGFAPGWFRLASELELAGQHGEARQARERFFEEHRHEPKLLG